MLTCDLLSSVGVHHLSVNFMKSKLGTKQIKVATSQNDHTFPKPTFYPQNAHTFFKIKIILPKPSPIFQTTTNMFIYVPVFVLKDI